MCFEYEYYYDEVTNEVRTATIPTHCDDCQREIPAGEPYHWQDGITWLEDDDGNETNEPDPDYSDVTVSCAECTLDRFLVHLHELAEGCHSSESWCPVGELPDARHYAGIERSSREDGLVWLNRKVVA